MSRFLQRRILLGCGLGLAAAACTPIAFVNNTTTLGGDNPGERGSIRVKFVNSTPFRAIFTFGSYDPVNPNFTPQFDQFFVDANAPKRLEGNSESATITFTCGRALSVGGGELIARIRDGELNAEDSALQPGVLFSDKPLDDPQAGEATAGSDEGIVTLQGVEFRCDDLLTYTLVQDAAQSDGFRIDLTVSR